MNAVEYILSKNRGDYQRDNFDSFLKKVKFSFSIPAIHIAGTNGKGSVAHFLQDIYSANGYKVGLFTSPDELKEMIKIDNNQIDDSYLNKIVDENKKLFEKYDLSTFEIETFIALSYFNDNKVDLAIIECGMGGEYDATNIFTPVLSIITSISIEHSEFLGVSLSEIAMHKCGIIKENVPVLIGDVKDDALNVVVNRSKQEEAKLIGVDDYHNLKQVDNDLVFDYRPYYGLRIHSLASYRVFDACLAIEATNILKDVFPINEDKLKEGLLNSKLKCRFEVSKDGMIILDGAHNPHGIQALRKVIDEKYYGKTIKVVFAAFKDKNIAMMLPEIGLIGNICLTTFNNARAREEADYFLYLEDYGFYPDYQDLIEKIRSEEPETVILVTGSLTFTYVVRKYLKEKGLFDD